MPRVPTYDNFQVAPTQQGGPGYAAPTPTTDPGQPAAQMGQALGQLADSQYRQMQQVQMEANQLRVDDALNKLKEAQLTLTHDKDKGYLNQRGVQALQRPDGKPLAVEYGEALKKQAEAIAKDLGNDEQRRAFGMAANNVLTSFTAGATQHEADQFREYALSVREGTIKNRMNEVGLNYRDPKAVDTAITSIRAAVADQARLLGKSAEWADAQTKVMTSNAHKVALSAALQANDVDYAAAYLKKYAGQMEADDLLRAQGIITQEVRQRTALGVATTVVQGAAPRMVTSDIDRAFNIALGTESGGRQFGPDGKPLTSPAGAVGIAQVMPGTGPEAAKLAGVKWDENRYRNDAEYNKAIGRAYFTRQLQDNGGDIAKAYAAYNAGPGRLQEAIKAAEKDGTHWLAKMPAETQAYVTKNLNAYVAGDGQYQRPTLQEVHAEVRQRVGVNDPHTLRLALEEATRQFDDMGRAVKQREDETTAQAMRELVKNGGKFSAIPVSVRSAIPPKEMDNLLNFGARIARGEDTTNMALYQKLATDQNYLRGLSDAQFFMLRPQLSEADFKHFANERAAMVTGAKNNPQELNTSAINTVLGDRLRTLNLDPTPKDGSAEAMRVGAIRKFVRESILDAQAQAGKKLTDAEVEKHIDGLFAKSVPFRNTFLGMTTSRTSERLLTMKAGDIPSDIRDKIKADFKAAGISEPTDADVLGAYWQLKTAKR